MTKILRDHTKPIPNPLVVLREEFDDWAVLFNPDTGDAMGINPVGVAVWKLLDGKRSVKDIVADVDKRFSEVPETAVNEIALFLENLAESGFVGEELEGNQR